MDSIDSSPLRGLARCCNCSHNCCSVDTAWFRNVKRKYDELQDNKRFFEPGLEHYSVARVQIENEITALREMVSKQQQTIQDLTAELEEERNASSSAANEAMSMILRLQRDKAEAQMEARQFKRFAEEKMGHDQQEILALEDLLYKREQAIQSLTYEVQAYRHRMMSYGLTESEADGRRGDSQAMDENVDGQFEYPPYGYPPLKCHFNETSGPWEGENQVADVEKFAHGETPRDRDQLKDLEHRIYQMECDPNNSRQDYNLPGVENIPEKIIVGQSPRQPRHSRRVSSDSLSILLGIGKDTGSDLAVDSPASSRSFKKMECVFEEENFRLSRKLNNTPETDDDSGDRICTVDSVFTGLTPKKTGAVNFGDPMFTPRGPPNCSNVGDQDPEITKLYMRLQALEADRESLRQAIFSMQTDKAQMLLLKEIAERLCRERSPEARVPIKKPSIFGGFISVFKWIGSFTFWRKKARRSKYLFGMSPDCVGLLILLEDRPDMRQPKHLTRIKRRL